MRKFLMLLALGGFFAASTMLATAAPKNTPGHQMQKFGSVPGHPGASGYAPGHLKKLHHVRSASAFAPRRHVRHHRHHRHHFARHHRHHYARWYRNVSR